jgi:hypothetical protein
MLKIDAISIEFFRVSALVIVYIVDLSSTLTTELSNLNWERKRVRYGMKPAIMENEHENNFLIDSAI